MKLPKFTNSRPLDRDLEPRAPSALTPQGCNWLTCGAKVIACAAACASGIGTAGCIACLGSAYDSCKDCF